MVCKMITVAWLCHFLASYIYPSNALVLYALLYQMLFFVFSLIYVARYASKMDVCTFVRDTLNY